MCVCVHVCVEEGLMCVLPKKSKEDKWHNATPFALNDQALLLAKEKGGPMSFKLLMCVCVCKGNRWESLIR